MGKKSAVSTPLILLQQLSRSLLRHFEEACEQALGETRRVLDKLEKQRRKIELRLREAELAAETAAVAGRAKALVRARVTMETLQAALDQVLDRQVQTHAYLLHLQRDVKTALGLAEGIARVDAEAAKELDAVAGVRPVAPRADSKSEPKALARSARKTADEAAESVLVTPPSSGRPVSKPARRKSPAPNPPTPHPQ